MPQPNDPRDPRQPRSRPDGQGGPREHDAFVVDTRRSKGNRRAMPQRADAPRGGDAPRDGDGPRRMAEQPQRRPDVPRRTPDADRGPATPRDADARRIRSQDQRPVQERLAPGGTPRDPGGAGAQAIPVRGARRDDDRLTGRTSDPRASSARSTDSRVGEGRAGGARAGDGRPAGRLPRRPGGAAGSAAAGSGAAGAAGAAGSAPVADEPRRTSPDTPGRDSTRAMPQGDAAGRDSTRAMPQGHAPRQGGRRRVIGGAAAAGAAGVTASAPARAADAGDVDAQRGLRPGGPGGPGGPDGTGGRGGSGDEPPRRRRRFGRGKKILAGVLVLLLLWVGGLVWAGMSAWGKVQKVDAIPSEHLADSGAGHNTLIVGSDGRSGLTTEQKKKLGTGNAEGQRTDSIMILHTGGGKPTLMSIPRDSYVTIPGHTKNKINASFSIGGPQLLIKTIEANTGIHVDDYMEIGFGGFASVVDAVGGVTICVAHDMNDPKAHINLKAGCQKMDGATALGYVRARYSDPEGDLGRAKRQRQFLGALMKEISSPSNLLVPWKLKGLGESGAQGLTVDKDMSMMGGLQTMWNLKKFSGDGGNSVVVPVGNAALPTAVGEVVEWDPQRSAELFKAIKENGDTSSFVKKTAN